MLYLLAWSRIPFTDIKELSLAKEEMVKTILKEFYITVKIYDDSTHA